MTKDELPMEVLLKGNVIFRQDEGKIVATSDQQTVRAPHLHYDFVTGRTVTPPAESDTTDLWFEAMVKDDVKVDARRTPSAWWHYGAAQR